MGATRRSRARRRALAWTGAYSAAVVVGASLLPLWVFVRPTDVPMLWWEDDICFWEAVRNAARDSDPAYLWTGLNRTPTLLLAALAVLTWPLTFASATFCRRPDGTADYDDNLRTTP